MSQPAIRPTPNVLSARLTRQLDAAVRTIVERFAPEQIILFGSHAWGTPGPDSDVDLLVVKSTNDPWGLHRQIDAALWERDFPLDLLIYRSDAVRRRIAVGDLFLQDVIQNGKVLYDRAHKRSQRVARQSR